MNKAEYLSLVAKRKQSRSPIELKMPSGAVWLCLPVNIKQYAITGKMPMNLVARLESVRNQPQQEISKEEMLKLGIAGMELTRDVMLNNLVFPRITLEETDESITPEQIDPEDFEYFMKWIQGGAQAQASSKSSATP